MTLPSRIGARTPKASDATAPGRVPADAGEGQQRIDGRRHLPAEPVDDHARRLLQVASTRVVAEPLPGVQHVLKVGRRQSGRRREIARRIDRKYGMTVATCVCWSIASLIST